MQRPKLTAFLFVLAAGVIFVNTPAGHAAVGFPDGPPAPSAASQPERFAQSPADRATSITAATKALCKGADARAKRIAKAHADWKAPGVALVACHRYAIGMTEDMLLASLGNPYAINRTETVGGSHQQWVYGNDYIYIDDGVVTSFQTSNR